METYHKLKQLGKGTFGTVYLCERKHNKLKIVVKEINDLDSQQLIAAKNEVAILKSLDHPNVIGYLDCYTKNNVFHIVMEYARHGSLHDLVRKHKPRNYIQKEILMALEHIHHMKILHRDLKCENIFLTGMYEDIVKIGDFGISKILGAASGTTDTVIGTTNYIAPEIMDGVPYGIKVDIWSVGCILYELCALERLFEGSMAQVVLAIKSTQRKVIDLVRYGTDIQRLIDLMVQSNPDDRPRAFELLADSYIFPIRYTLIMELGLTKC